jgi:hypothetical protein
MAPGFGAAGRSLSRAPAADGVEPLIELLRE